MRPTAVPSDAPGDATHGFAADPARVLFVWDHLGYPNGATHGLTRYCLDVLPRLDDGPVKLTACFLREEHRAGAELSRRGVDPIFLGRSKWDPRAFLDVLRLIRAHRIEVVHAAGHKGILVGRTAGRLAGCGVIVHLGDVIAPPRLVRPLLRAGARWTDAALGVSRAVCDYAVSEFRIPPERVELLYNGFDAAGFTRPTSDEVGRWRREQEIAPGARLVGVVGRLAPEKGHARLLRQMRRVRERVPDSLLVVAGDGPLRSELHDLATRLGIADAVRFLGQQDDVRPLMAALDVLAVPSDHEGFSFVTVEALTLGTPVVGTDRGGLAEVAGDGRYAVLFSPSDEDSLGDALIRVFDDPAAARRMAHAAGEHLQQFSLETHVRRQREVYLRVTGAVRARRAAGRPPPREPAPRR